LKSTANFLIGNVDQAGKPRFRKRDKMLFYGRRMLRKVKEAGQGGRRRKAVMKFASRILQMKNEKLEQELKDYEPPAEYLEEARDKPEGGSKVPVDILYMLESIRIFGQFEKPVFLKICKHTEIINVKAGEHLIKIGDFDDSVFIVQTGLINVFLNNPDGSAIALKVVKKGETVTSLLSFIDVIVVSRKTVKISLF
jgi:lysophospholipid hydrolase